MGGYKPLGKKSYGTIAHLPGSRLGPGDHKITDGQARIATKKVRDKHDVVIIQEKLDGSNVAVALKNDKIIPLNRAGYIASTSPFEMHHLFYDWVFKNEDRFRAVLKEGERICGEWLTHAHGTRYNLPHEPLVVFDLFDGGNRRLNYMRFKERVQDLFVLPHLVSYGNPMSIESVMAKLGKHGFHGALDPVEGAVWRVERKGVVDFLCKYVRHDKEDGKYLDQNVMNNYVENQNG
jgi:hypothetical protein